MLIDKVLPRYDVTEVQELEVDAPPELTYAAIRRADLRDPIIDALFTVRELPNRVARKLRHESPPPAPRSFTFADLARPEMGWVSLGEERGTEFVVGSVGRFWKRDYGWKQLPAQAFAGFQEPGYAKIALSFAVNPVAFGRSVLRYEARTATTDKHAHARFRRYWMIIHPGVAIVMRRALGRIKLEAERQAARRHQVLA